MTSVSSLLCADLLLTLVTLFSQCFYQYSVGHAKETHCRSLENFFCYTALSVILLTDLPGHTTQDVFWFHMGPCCPMPQPGHSLKMGSCETVGLLVYILFLQDHSHFVPDIQCIKISFNFLFDCK